MTGQVKYGVIVNKGSEVSTKRGYRHSNLISNRNRSIPIMQYECTVYMAFPKVVSVLLYFSHAQPLFWSGLM